MVGSPAWDGGFYLVAVIYLSMLGLIFIGMANNVIPMAQGIPPDMPGNRPTREPLWTVVPPAVLAGLVAVLGLWLPRPVEQVIESISVSVRTAQAEVAESSRLKPHAERKLAEGEVFFGLEEYR